LKIHFNGAGVSKKRKLLVKVTFCWHCALHESPVCHNKLTNRFSLVNFCAKSYNLQDFQLTGELEREREQKEFHSDELLFLMNGKNGLHQYSCMLTHTCEKSEHARDLAITSYE
jgi:hypothetical protein